MHTETATPPVGLSSTFNDLPPHQSSSPVLPLPTKHTYPRPQHCPAWPLDPFASSFSATLNVPSPSSVGSSSTYSAPPSSSHALDLPGDGWESVHPLTTSEETGEKKNVGFVFSIQSGPSDRKPKTAQVSSSSKTFYIFAHTQLTTVHLYL